MENIKMIKLRDHADLKEDSAKWFHEKWGIPAETYLESMEMCLKSGHPVPQWYVVMDDSKIVAGIGVIENDFHHRIALNYCVGLACCRLQFYTDAFLQFLLLLNPGHRI